MEEMANTFGLEMEVFEDGFEEGLTDDDIKALLSWDGDDSGNDGDGGPLQ
jgi:hypothetical protein